MAVANRRSVAKAGKSKGVVSLDAFVPEQGEEKVVHVNLGASGSLELVFDTDNLTMEFQAELEEAVAAQSITRMADIIFGRLRSWNLADADGEILPLEPASWRKMPLQMFWKIIEAFNTQVQAPKAETSNA